MSKQPSGNPVSRWHRWRTRCGLLAVALAVLGICVMLRYAWGPESADAKAPPRSGVRRSAATRGTQSAATQTAAAATPPQAAIINGETITREELARECLAHYGNDVLEALVNKYLIAEHCQRHKIVVTQGEVQQEIENLAARFRLPKEHYLSMLEKERGITAKQYSDMTWVKLATQKLAAGRIAISPEEMNQALESEFGPSVRARMIVCNSRQKAEDLHRRASANPDDFPALAKQSDDVNTASTRGLVQPIRRHVGEKAIEQVAFGLQPGEVSDIIPIGHQFVILKCESHLPARPIPAGVREQITERVKFEKIRAASEEVFLELQQQASVENIFNDPVKSRRLPTVAAIVNGRQIGVAELADTCLQFHGREVLEILIARRLVQMACREKNVAASQAEVDAQLVRVARASGAIDPGGKPDVPAWLATVKQKSGLSSDVYVRDVIEPDALLRKLVARTVTVSEEDVHKGFEANYGPRVRCRAIVLNSMRRAQEVWQMARDNPSVEFFAQLSQKYSVELSTRELGGQVAPIQKHGGRPLLEKEAFSLQPGELSAITQIADEFVILFCEGYTTPTPVEPFEVRDLVYNEIYEKKLNLAMNAEFERLHDSAHIINYVTNDTQKPQQTARAPVGAVLPTAATIRR